MRTFLARFVMILAVAAVAACGETQKSTQAESKAEPPPSKPAPSASQPPAPVTPVPVKPVPAAPAPKAVETAPPAVASPPAPSPAPQEAPKAAAAESHETLVISVAHANMREKPDTKGRIIQVLGKGTKLGVVKKGDHWYRVRLANGTEGWVAESVVTPAR